MSELSEPVTTGCRGAPVAVIGTPDEKWGELITALIVASGPALTEEELIAHCRTRLAGYKCPKRIVFVDSLARTATGKLQVTSLPTVANTRSPVSVWTKGSFGVTMKQHEDFGACRTSNLRIRRTAEVRRRSAIRR